MNLQDVATQIADKVIQMRDNDEFRDIDEMYQTYMESMFNEFPDLNADGGYTIKYDPEYDDNIEIVRNILAPLKNNFVRDFNITVLNDVLMITVLTTKGAKNAKH